MKYVAIINKVNSVCETVTILKNLEPDNEQYATIQREVENFSYTNRKYDIQNEKWLDEYVEPPKMDSPQIEEPPSIESLEKHIKDLEDRTKKDNLLLLKTLLEAVEELTSSAGSEGV